MKFTVLTEQPVKQKFVLLGEEEYLKRMKGSVSVELKTGDIAKAPARSWIFALDEHGIEYTSEKFAQRLQKKMVEGTNAFTFLIGGPYGLTDASRKNANETIAISKFTCTYQMTRLILVEQLYRAVTIIEGKPYHEE